MNENENSQENKTVTAVNGEGETKDVIASGDAIQDAEKAGNKRAAAKTPVKKKSAKKAAKKSASPEAETEKLQFVGKALRWNKKRAVQEKVLREAPAFIIDGREKIKLPKDLDKGAVEVDAATAQRARTLFPADFKTQVSK